MDIFTTMDSETASLILRLQLEDSNSLSFAYEDKGKGIEGVLSDTQLALQLYTEELQSNATIIADRRMTHSLARACQTDGNILSLSFSQELQEARDRHVEEEDLDDEVVAKLNALYMCAAEGDPDSDSDTEDNSRALVPYYSTSSPDEEASKLAATRNPRRHCTACREIFPFCDLGRAPCSHEYCPTCLRDLFKASMTDDTLFPPRCCRQLITLSTAIRIHLTPTITHLYYAKKIEFDTLNRTYCSNRLCSSFIRKEFLVEDSAECQVCQVVTCTICKGEAHAGDCPEDEALKLVLETARKEKWQRCYNCHRLVELDTGCNHMTCPCSAQFCYNCGSRWKSCRCEQWDEYRLYDRAEVVIARQPTGHQFQFPEERQERLAAVLQDLQDRHNYTHASWEFVRGSSECEECRDRLPSYSFRCQQCHLQTCNRCRRNRL